MAEQVSSPSTLEPGPLSRVSVKGVDGWLFDSSAVALFTGQGSLGITEPGKSCTPVDAEAVAAEWFEQLSDNAQWLSAQGIQYLHVCVPDKLRLMSEFHGSTTDAAIESPMQRLSAGYKSRLPFLLDPSKYLLRQKSHHPLYWKADTRWSPWACYMTYQLLCGQLGVELNRLLLGSPHSDLPQAMNLDSGLMASTAQAVRHYRFHVRSRQRYANKLASMRASLIQETDASLSCDDYGLGAHTVYENHHKEASRLTVVLCGDANSGDGRTLLTGMLAETFAEVHFVWAPTLDRDYIEQVKPDIVITQASELQMACSPVDNFDMSTVAQLSLHKLEQDLQTDKLAGRLRETGVETSDKMPTELLLLAAEEYELPPPGVVQAHDETCERETRMQTNEISLTDVSDATVYFTGPDWLVHDGQGREVLRHNRSDHPLPRVWQWGRHRSLPGTTLMFGSSAGAHCYYHWMLELLPKLGLLERQGIALDSIDHFLVRKISGDWQRQTLARFGIGASRIVETEHQPRLRCDRLLHIDINCGINLKMPRFIPQWMKHLYPANTKGLPRLKLYITRPQGVRRGISNEAQILPLLRDAGFTIMAMEGMSVAEQAALLTRVDVLMSPHGGALTNMVFCRPGITVIELFSRHVFPYYYGLAANCGHHYHAILENPEEDYPRLVNSRIAQNHANDQHETAELSFEVSVDAVRDLLSGL